VLAQAWEAKRRAVAEMARAMMEKQRRDARIRELEDEVWQLKERAKCVPQVFGPGRAGPVQVSWT
jgi:hypothetical protein